MIVECSGCSTIFPVDPKKVPTAGIHARCSVCSEVFFVIVPEPEGQEVEPAELEPQEEEALPEADFEIEEETADGPVEEDPEDGEESWEEEFLDDTADALDEGTTALEEAVADVVEEIPEGPPPSGPLFGKRDPTEKAQRLARVLVSDIILYNPDRHHDATESGRVKEEFEEEIQKSWDEYVEQVGDEIANSTDFFTDALNEILAKGEKIF